MLEGCGPSECVPSSWGPIMFVGFGSPAKATPASPKEAEDRAGGKRSSEGETARGLLAALSAEFDRLAERNQELSAELQQCQQQLKKKGAPAAKPPKEAAIFQEPSEKNPNEDANSSLADWHVQQNGGDQTVRSERSEGAESQGTQQNAEEEYERLYDLTRAFTVLCQPHRQSISVPDLLAMVANQENVPQIDPRIKELRPRYSEAIKALNTSVRISSKDITLDTFLAIMNRRREFFTSASEENVATIVQIKDVLVKEDAFRKVAKATNMSHHDLSQAKRPAHYSKMERFVQAIDPCIGIVIILNAIIIYVSTDYSPDAKEWQWVEATFTVIFLMEFLVKLATQGREFCLGSERYWNIFDAIVCVVASTDLIWSLMSSFENLRTFTIMRVLRFARLTKLVRVLKLKIFKELTLMVNGIFAGIRTLIWAVVFLFFLLFVLGVLLTQSVGRAGFIEQTECGDGLSQRMKEVCGESKVHLIQHRDQLFGTVLRSAFTVFRCITDGCESVDGTPLVPYFYNTHGTFVISMYMIVILFVMFGLFNLIMAIFVETTIANAGNANAKRYEARYKEDLQIAKRLQDIIEMFCLGDVPDEEPPPKPGLIGRVFGTAQPESYSKRPLVKKSTTTETLSVTISHTTFNKVLVRQDVQHMLDDLDIAPGNRESLFDILDANNDGTLEVSELVQGLLKLRGFADKGEIVAALLAIRSMQKSIKAMQVLSLEHGHVIEGIANSQHKLEAQIKHSHKGDRHRV